MMAIVVDHIATASIWSRRLRGTSAGTKLGRVCQAGGERDGAHSTHSTLAWRATTGLRGVEMDERRSRMLEEDKVLVADARVRRASILIWRQRDAVIDSLGVAYVYVHGDARRRTC